MGDYSEVFVAFDVAKLKNAVAIAEAGRVGEVRYLVRSRTRLRRHAGWLPSGSPDKRD